MKKQKVAVLTGSRAEYGLLYCLMKVIENDPEFELQIIVSGMHLSPEFGLSYRQIEEDGFIISEKVEMLMSSDSAVGVAKSIGLGVIGFADAFNRLNPDLLIVLGDRFEIFAAVQAALIARIPVAHLAGGDITEAAFDEAIRHSISKMSHLHFANNEISAQRICQLGENPEHVFYVGSTGIDYIKRIKLLSRDELEKILHFEFRAKNLLITFHPVTLDELSSSQQFEELLTALDQLELYDLGLIFTKANADTGGRSINDLIDRYVASKPWSRAYLSLGQQRYWSLIKQVDAVVGNSSSGILEVPYFKKPTVNIGDRQKGRMQALSVINCQADALAISTAIKEAFNKDCSDVSNPYGDGKSSDRVISILKSIKYNGKNFIKKKFYEFNVGGG